ncbi:uncharacterized protein LOC126979099 [Leptidea sinapis]|uniref:uncharacterized protein LOC126979099 n=1 Tax=Leptidea sinapis TaxID=189913 RepID=UPI00213341EA|nr:uncharacterized protein LOC126979099 [Leptidea sinapis]
MISEAFLAGLWAAIGNTLGKTAGTVSIVGDSHLIWLLLLVVMVMVNTWGLRLFMRSLDASDNTVLPIVISSASSYVLSGIVGVFLFNEDTSRWWWCGILTIIMGLMLISLSNQKSKPDKTVIS